MDKPFVFSLKSPIDNKPFIIEEWRVIDNNVCEGATGTAEISNLGRIRKRSTHAIRKPYITPFGYLRIAITIQNNRQRQCFVHQLAMRAFCPLLDYSNVEVNHIDGNKLNNCLYNLCWVSRSENVKFAYMNKQLNAQRGSDNTRAAVDEETANKIGMLLSKNKLKKSEIANICNCSVDVVYNISTGRTYNHIYQKYKLYNKPIHALTNNNVSEYQENIIVDTVRNNCPEFDTIAELYEKLIHIADADIEINNGTITYIGNLLRRNGIDIKTIQI